MRKKDSIERAFWISDQMTASEDDSAEAVRLSCLWGVGNHSDRPRDYEQI